MRIGVEIEVEVENQRGGTSVRDVAFVVLGTVGKGPDVGREEWEIAVGTCISATHDTFRYEVYDHITWKYKIPRSIAGRRQGS